MRKQLSFLLICLLFVPFLNEAQNTVTAKPLSTVSSLPSMDAFAVIPIKDCGWGGGFNLLSKPYNIGQITFNTPLQVRLGGEFFITELTHKNLTGVALIDPPKGNAKVRLSDNLFGLNGMARFSLPYSKKVIPYLDVFGGLRAFTSNISITPEVYSKYNSQSTTDNLATVAQFNYGGTMGVMISLGEWVKFNTGLMYTTSKTTGEVINTKTAYVESGNIITDKILTSRGKWVAKIGFTFLISPSNKKNCNCDCNRKSGGVRVSTGSVYTPTRTNHVNITIRPTK